MVIVNFNVLFVLYYIIIHRSVLIKYMRAGEKKKIVEQI